MANQEIRQKAKSCSTEADLNQKGEKSKQGAEGEHQTKP